MDDEFAKFYEECSEIEKAEQENEPGQETSHATKAEHRNKDRETDCTTVPTPASDVAAEVAKSNGVSEEDVSVMKEGSDNNITINGSERIYTDPKTKEEFSWSDEMKQWVPRGYKPFFDGKTYRYIDKEGSQFRWNTESSNWEKTDENVVNEGGSTGPEYSYDGENYTFTDPKDQTVYFWDKEKNAWFPKVDDDFMARYQMSYGFVDNTTNDEPSENDDKKKEGKRKAPSEPSWFDLDDAHNTKVYVTNLPLDISEQDFVDFMQKCGLVLKDPKTNKFKVKLYKEPDGTLKGDALCDYLKVESVELALNVLDGANFRDKKVNVQRAKFQMRGDYNPKLKPKKKRKSEKEKEKKIKEKLLDWRPDKLRGEREKHERTVVLKNLFTSSTFDEKVELILEFTEDIRSEATKCGVVRKVVLHDKHPEGVATVTFSDAEEADICVKFFNNRWFGKRKITAETWDGKTKYKVIESEGETKERLEKWNEFLEQGDKTT